MAKKFKVKWKRNLVWHSRMCVGTSYIQQMDKMSLMYDGGAQEEIPEWSKCQVKVGVDWFAAAKANMEAQAGQAIPTNE